MTQHRKVQTLDQLHKRAKWIATRRGYSQFADDFAQEVALLFLERPNRHSTLDQFFTDFLRSSFGDIRSRSGRARHREIRQYTDITARRHPTTEQRYDDRLRVVIAQLSGITKSAAELFLTDLNLEEIGQKLGVTESRISQLINGIKDKKKVRPIVHEWRSLNP